MRYMTMAEMVEESGISRYTIMPALQLEELHGGQPKTRGTWRVEEACFRAWMLNEPCPHGKGGKKAKKKAKAA
ncbi:hypothetical protein [Microbacterium sp. zg-YB36]|uniref:hypothetical protein n=1 Tax=Microbacterium sp. zg-YB36 TaxID=2969407 RepID=UPI00214CFCAB|nr:hypothetical protein [Microbacterium sp. zg-YB36]MDL5351092.1 hypothetical protein [Microbacterium sp. zg-YB36]